MPLFRSANCAWLASHKPDTGAMVHTSARPHGVRPEGRVPAVWSQKSNRRKVAGSRKCCLADTLLGRPLKFVPTCARELHNKFHAIHANLVKAKNLPTGAVPLFDRNGNFARTGTYPGNPAPHEAPARTRGSKGDAIRRRSALLPEVAVQRQRPHLSRGSLGTP